VSEISIAVASADDIRAIARRRKYDEAALRVALEFADRGTVWTARDGGEAVGIAIAHAAEEERYVGELFVEPSYRGQGIGGRLLDAAFAEADDAARVMLVDPAEPAASALAYRRGLAPRELVVRFAGAIPQEEELARMAAGSYRFGVEALDQVAHELGIAALDRETRGRARDADHAFFARFATGQVFFLDGDLVAYAYVSPDGHVGPLACAAQAYLVQIFAYVLVTLARRHRASWCTTLVPGANLRIARAALRAGLRIEQTFALARDSGEMDLSRYVASNALLF
jgi:GNAT superfamily N-acetyltransferase